MPYWVCVFLEFTILISIVISFVKFKQISRDYLPFVFSLWVTLISSVVGLYFSLFHRNNAAPSNIYFIVFCLLILWQFKQWKLFAGCPKAFYGLMGAFVASWVLDTFVVGSLFKFNPYARIIISFVIVILSIQLLSGERQMPVLSFWRSSIQLILTAYIVLFTVKIITEFFWQYGVILGDDFMISIFYFYIFVNFLANLLYALAMLWIPVTTRYSWPLR